MNPPTCFKDKLPTSGRHIYKAYILLKHQMYIHNVEIYKSSYKYNKMPDMDSVMLTYFWLKFISMPLFTMCVIIHTDIYTQTSNIADFDPEGSSPCACIDVSCIGESSMNNTKERIVHLQRKRYQESAKNAIW